VSNMNFPLHPVSARRKTSALSTIFPLRLTTYVTGYMSQRTGICNALRA
jgi:hypothetical protein